MAADVHTEGGPGAPDCRSPGRFIWWLILAQRRRVARGATIGTLWMVGLTVPPYLLSRAIDDGLQVHHTGALVGWTLALFGVGVANAWLAMMRHRTMTWIRLDAAYRTEELVVRQACRLGGSLASRATTGEVATIGISDVFPIATSLTMTGPGVGAVVAYVVVAVLLLSVSPLLAAVVLVGVPVLAVAVGPLLGRLQGVQTTYRTRQGGLAARLVDTIGGLRVLNGLGGKEAHAARYRRESQALRLEGYRVGAVTSWIQALGIGLPTLFLAAVTWLAARMAAEGSITIGELVAVYGYAAILVVPVAFFIEAGNDLGRALVAARRVTGFLNLRADVVDPPDPADAPPAPAPLHDPVSGVRVAPGGLTALVGARPADTAAVIDRLGRFVESDATWGGTRLAEIAVAPIRDRILVADNEAELFAGTVRQVIAGRHDPGGPAADAALDTAVRAAAAQDIVDGLPAGLDSVIRSQGRNISGGQRQRIRLARALRADPEVLLAVEPTSAVDAPTESVLAARLRAARAGRTTVVTTTSPLVLDEADTVCFLVGGRLVAEGRHGELLATQPGYRALVSRGAGDEDDEAEESR